MQKIRICDDTTMRVALCIISSHNTLPDTMAGMPNPVACKLHQCHTGAGTLF
jgi:hypothetical protein